MWMASHAFWATALLISVTTGRRYAAESLREFGGIGGLCDAAFSNGRNGPFGYGQNSAAENSINILILGGACVAVVLAVWSIRQHSHRLVVVNLVIGAVGGAWAGMSTFGQHEKNPYCSPRGWWVDAILAVVLLTSAAATNLAAGRRTRTGHRSNRRSGDTPLRVESQRIRGPATPNGTG